MIITINPDIIIRVQRCSIWVPISRIGKAGVGACVADAAQNACPALDTAVVGVGPVIISRLKLSRLAAAGVVAVSPQNAASKLPPSTMLSQPSHFRQSPVAGECAVYDSRIAFRIVERAACGGQVPGE